MKTLKPIYNAVKDLRNQADEAMGNLVLLTLSTTGGVARINEGEYLYFEDGTFYAISHLGFLEMDTEQAIQHINCVFYTGHYKMYDSLEEAMLDAINNRRHKL